MSGNEVEAIYLGGTPQVSTAGQYAYTLDPPRSLSNERSMCTKLSITIAILSSLALKIVSLLVLFSRIEAKATLETKHMGTHTLFSDFLSDFSFPQMIHDFYEAKAYLMCFLIIIGSAVTPICKHVFMLLVWWFPVSTRWSGVRRTMLLFFDQTGKTALVDLFLIGYVICIFYTKIDLHILPGATLEMLIQGEPVRGLFLATASMFVGNFLSHYMLVLHDLQAKGKFERQVTVAVGPVCSSLSKRLWISMGSNRRGWAWHMVVPLMIAFGLISLPIIAQQELMAFQLSGLVGEVTHEPPRAFSLLTAPFDMPTKSQNYYGSIVLAVMHITLALVIPFCLLVASIVLWFVPIDLRPQRRLLSYFPFWFSWCTLDVFLITSLAAYMEMDLIAVFTFDNQFPELCAQVQQHAGMPCAGLEHELKWPGMVLLCTVCLILGSIAVVVSVVGGNLLETNTMDEEDLLVMDNPLLLSRTPSSPSSSSSSPSQQHWGDGEHTYTRAGVGPV